MPVGGGCWCDANCSWAAPFSPQPAPAPIRRGGEELLPAHFLFKPYFVFSVSATRQHGGGAVVGDRMAKR